MKKTYISIGIIAALLLTFLIWFGMREPAQSGKQHADETAEHHSESESGPKEVVLNEAQYKAAGIVLGSTESKNLSEVINANGYTKLPPQNQADVSVFISGLVQDIFVTEGQFVRKGQTLAMIESLEFTKLQEAFLSSESNLELLGAEYERQKTLQEENVNSKKTLQRAKAEYEIEKARHASLQTQMRTLKMNGRSKATSTIPVTAPISGYITEVNVRIGTNATPGEPLFSMVDNSKMHVDLLVYEKDLQKVKPGQSVHFILTNQDNTEITGKIFSIGKAFENETKSVAVHADILNDKQILIPGMYVNALIDIGNNAVQALPAEAVVRADGREFIFVLETEEAGDHEDQDHAADHDHKEAAGESFHFQRIEVKTGTAQLGYVQVTMLQPVAEQAQIVLKGAYYIQSHLLKSEGGGGHAH